MKFTSFKKNFLSLFIMVLTTGSSNSSERITGAQVKDTIVAQAAIVGISVMPQTPDQKVYYPCADPLSIIPKGKDWKTVEVICSSPFEWKINVRNIVKTFESKRPVSDTELSSERKVTQVEYIPKLKVPTKLKEISRPVPYATSIHKPLRQTEGFKTSKLSTSKKAIRREALIKKGPTKSFEYFILNEPLNKGAIISSINQLKTKLFKREVRGGYLDSSQIIGRELKVAVPAGQPILSRFLTTNYAVKKDTVLNLILQRSGIRVTSQGLALSNGQLGEIILVSNLSSGVKLRAKIKNSHEAEIITKQLN